MRHVVFGVRRRLDAIEHVVGRVVHKQDAGLARLFRKHADGRAIDRGRELFLLLCAVDRRIGGRIHDDIGLYAADETRQKFGLREIASAAIGRHHVAERHQASTQFPADLTARRR